MTRPPRPHPPSGPDGRVRHGWLAQRLRPITDDHKQQIFRSDQDLHQWRFAYPFLVNLTLFSLALLHDAHIGFRYSPVAVVPALIAYAWLRWRSWRQRRLGRRFGDYDSDWM